MAPDTLCDLHGSAWTTGLLLAHLSALRRSLGHRPRTRDIVAAHKAHPDAAPSLKVYMTRFGTLTAALAILDHGGPHAGA